MNNRESNWYEGEHGNHRPNCNCVECTEKRLKKMGRTPRYEIVHPRSWERELKVLKKRKKAVNSIKFALVMIACIVIVLALLGIEPFISWKEMVVDKIHDVWAYAKL